ncbi:xylulokinase [Staphylococcus schleiferi]|uniref:xylulokinase n=1 Tax=Staphylococcus schleiferi TaxID=1295 RepID=UPI0024806945|nr:FGGY-family carbohydrate kinase [Staphylococcus schleiferi]
MAGTDIREAIEKGDITVGIELGSTRIKAVAIDASTRPIAKGSYEWTQQLKAGYWSLSLDEVWRGLQESYQRMSQEIYDRYHIRLKKLAALGISGMMHGYLAFDQEGKLLVPFRTWQNNYAREAGAKLTHQFQFNVPERWSIAQYYQCVCNREAHVKDVAYLTTLSGYVHWQLTDEKVLGIGDASGMFPIDAQQNTYRKDLMAQFDALMKEQGFSQSIESILPKVYQAGERAGLLTATGAKRLDPDGFLKAGCVMCPPEGDAGTGMIATNSIAPKTGNVSAGTSIFSMIVLEQPLKQVDPDVDIVMTPAGDEVAMIHANNCTSDINQWMHLFEEVFQVMGVSYDKETLWTRLFEQATQGDDDLGQLLSYGYVSGEFITDIKQGFPLFMCLEERELTLANFMKTHIYSALSTLKIGVDRLKKHENIALDRMTGHGGIFKTKNVVQRYLAAALETPITVMETANEGGAWGIAVLARYIIENHTTLDGYLNTIFKDNLHTSTWSPQPQDIESFKAYIQRFEKYLTLERELNKKHSNRERRDE